MPRAAGEVRRHVAIPGARHAEIGLVEDEQVDTPEPVQLAGNDGGGFGWRAGPLLSGSQKPGWVRERQPDQVELYAAFDVPEGGSQQRAEQWIGGTLRPNAPFMGGVADGHRLQKRVQTGAKLAVRLHGGGKRHDGIEAQERKRGILRRRRDTKPQHQDTECAGEASHPLI
ncbi:MAG: hypothetical protein IPM24_17490 [Bryobacterales bacterium]|nr:hypothetical protein [Bryobacterales bacterium]